MQTALSRSEGMLLKPVFSHHSEPLPADGRQDFEGDIALYGVIFDNGLSDKIADCSTEKSI
jgi:hypothetical protein